MLRFTTIVAAAVIITTALTAVAGKKQQQDIEWLPHLAATQISDTEPINHQLRFWLPLRNTKLAMDAIAPVSTETLAAWAEQHDGGCSGDFFSLSSTLQHVDASDDVGRRLQLWRRIVAPDCATVARAKQSLKQAGLDKYCVPTTGNGLQSRYDAFFCDTQVPAGVAAAALGVEFERVREALSGQVRLSVKKEQLNNIQPLAGIEFVTNHIVGGADAQPQRRFRPRARAPSTIEQLQTRLDDKLRASGQTGFAPLPNQTVDGNAPQLLEWAALAPTSLNPREQPYFAAIVATDIHCSDASPSLAYLENGAAKLGCANKSAVLPESVDIEVVKADGTTVVASWVGQYVSIYCRPVPAVNPAGYPNTTGVCSFPLMSGGDKKNLNELAGTWQSIFPRVRANFKNGTTGSSYFHSPWSYAKSWWARNYYDAANARVYTRNSSSIAKPSGYQPQLANGSSNKNLSLAFSTTGWTLFPKDYKKMYNTPPSTIKGVAQAMFEIGLPGFLGPQYKKEDLALFMERIGAKFNASRARYLGGSVNGENAVDGESQLDIQTMMSFNENAELTYMYVYNMSHAGLGSLFDAFTEYFSDIVHDTFFGKHLAGDARPIVHSMSYGLCISSTPYNETTTLKMLERQSQHVAMASGAGVQIFVSSGDASSSCSPQEVEIMAGYPASLPHVISVGATMIGAAGASRWELPAAAARHVCDTNRGALIGSGGGPMDKNVIPRPAYQNAPCPYQTFNGWGATNCSNIGRMVPDISAIGTSIFAVVGGNASTGAGNTTMAGTSFSSPLAAAFFARIASTLKHNGKTFSNMAAFVYSNHSLWRDVTQGSTCYGRGPMTNYFGLPVCYSAQEGYDWTSGLGELHDGVATAAAAEKWAAGTTTTTAAPSLSTTTTSGAATQPATTTSGAATQTSSTEAPSTSSASTTTAAPSTSSVSTTTAAPSTSSGSTTTAAPSTSSGSTTTAAPSTIAPTPAPILTTTHKAEETTTTAAAATVTNSTTAASPGAGGNSGASSGSGSDSGSGGSKVSIGELVGAAVGSLIAGVLLGALVMRWRYNKAQEEGGGTHQYYRDELRTQHGDSEHEA